MKNYIKILFVLLMLPVISVAQEENTEDSTIVAVKDALERPAFESATLIDNPTNVLFDKNTLEVQMQHRFGLINETNTLAGIYGDGANIRIALSYAIHERLTIGYGTTKNNRLQDFNWKVALLRQTKSNSMPVSVSYYGNFTIDARPESTFNLEQDRYSFFNQVIIAKKFTPNLSLQIAPSIAHYNAVESDMENDMFAIAFGGRVKISPQTAIIFDYSQPITKFDSDPKPGISIGTEFSTSAHAFQIFLTNYTGIVSQKNHMFNQNDFFNGDFLIGFNITRNYNF
ncbi:MAG: DUF5777 family beta-barrel protein [Lutibacter sp.]